MTASGEEPSTDCVGPLQGVRVLDVTTAWAGPMAACVLADLGADVVRVDLPDSRAGQPPPRIPGSRLSLFYETVQRNKRSIGIDLRMPAGRDLFLTLVRTADLVIENFRPGTLDAWGIGYQACRAVNSRIVVVSISGWGQHGSGVGRGAYDPVIQAAAGWMSLNGEKDGEPTRSPTYLADDIAGLHAAIGALAALRHRDRAGEGQHVDVAMLDALIFQSNGMLTMASMGAELRRWGNELDIVVPSNMFACIDGSVYIAVALDKHWRRLANEIGRPELARAPGYKTNSERRGNRAAVNCVVAKWCGTRRVAEILGAADRLGIAASEVREFAAVAADQHVAERGLLQPVSLSDGTTVPLTAPPVKFSRTPVRIRNAAPQPGADTDELLREAGISEAARSRLRESGVI
jgi:formyl-CoA transferase